MTYTDILQLCAPFSLLRVYVGVRDEIESNLEIPYLNLREIILRTIIYKSMIDSNECFILPPFSEGGIVKLQKY